VGDEWMTIRNFSTPIEAHMAAGLLVSAGIQSRIFDEHMIGIHPLSSLALGGVRLQVLRSRATEALGLLNPRPFSIEDDVSNEV
jgi:hypothetical protein